MSYPLKVGQETIAARMPNEKPHNYIIRIATNNDAARLAALTQALLQHERGVSQDTNPVNPWAATAEELAKQINAPNTKFFVAECEAELVGFIRAVIVGLPLTRAEIGWTGWLENWLEKIARRSFIFFLQRPRPLLKIESGYLAGAFVAQAFRRRGIGNALAVAAENWFREHGLRHSELHVLFNNEIARQMWEELGYESLALSMRKKL